MADYPASVYAPRTKANRSGVEYDPTKQTVIFADDIQKLDAEVVALETEMGLTPHSRARAFLPDNQSIADQTYTKVVLSQESYDTLGEFDSATNYRFTAQKAGYYQANAAALFNPTVDGKRCGIDIYRNGVEMASSWNQASTNGDFIGVSVSDVIYLAAGQYLELYVWQNTGDAQNVVGGSKYTFFSIHKLSP